MSVNGYTCNDGTDEHSAPLFPCSYWVVSRVMDSSCQGHTQNEQFIRPHRLASDTKGGIGTGRVRAAEAGSAASHEFVNDLRVHNAEASMKGGLMLTKNQARTTGAMLRRRLPRPMTTVCAVLLAAGAWLPAHGQSGSSPATAAAAPERSACETEGALALTRTQRAQVQQGPQRPQVRRRDRGRNLRTTDAGRDRAMASLPGGSRDGVPRRGSHRDAHPLLVTMAWRERSFSTRGALTSVGSKWPTSTVERPNVDLVGIRPPS